MLATDDLILQLRRTFGDRRVRTDIDEVGRDGPGDDGGSDAPPHRAVGPAAMVIVDQIMGPGATMTASVGVERSHLRTREGDAYPVGDDVVIGRQPGEHGITVPDGRVSRSHARIRHRDGALVVEDLGSSNGTFVVRNGELLRVDSEPVGVQVGDKIETSGTLLLVEIVEEAEAT